MVQAHKSTVNTGSGVEDVGPLTRKVLEFVQTMERLVPAAKARDFAPAGWAPLAEFAAVDEFERLGTQLEVMNWNQYTEMLTRWARAVAGFETTLRRVSELRGLVYLEVEERHDRGDKVTVVNSMTVFEFDEEGRIRHLDVYLQQAR